MKSLREKFMHWELKGWPKPQKNRKEHKFQKRQVVEQNCGTVESRNRTKDIRSKRVNVKGQ